MDRSSDDRSSENGVKKIKKTIIKILAVIGGFSVAIIILFAIAFGWLVYKLTMEPITVDTSISTNGEYSMTLMQYGEPRGFFGPAEGDIILKQGKKVIVKHPITVYNDGGFMSKNTWAVTWYEKYVEVVIDGCEQYPQLYTVHFDGTVEKTQLDDSFDSVVDETELDDVSDNYTSYNDEFAEDYTTQKKQMRAIFDYLITDGCLAELKDDQNAEIGLDFEFNAKGNCKGTVCVITEPNGSRIVRYLMHNKYVEIGNYDEYVLYQDVYFTDGTLSENYTILAFFSVDSIDLEVTDLHRTDW